MIKSIKLLILLAVLCCVAMDAGATTVQACPMCKIATEDAGDDRQPQAYMASIITMLSMPAALFTFMGISLYRISSKEQQIADDLNEKSAK